VGGFGGAGRRACAIGGEFPRRTLLETVRKVLRARSRREFGQYREDEMGIKVPFERLVGLGYRPVRAFSDSFRRLILGNSEGKRA
jgi:hypothetical protein